MNGSRTRRRRILPTTLVVLAIAGLTGCSLFEAEPRRGDDVFSIVVGDCLDDADVPAEVTAIPILGCAEPHDSEVFARTEAAGDEFPGAEVLEAELTDFCRGEAFADFIGMPFAQSMYGTKGYYPTAASWGSGDRELLCTVVDPGGAKLTGSLAGVAQ